MVSAPAVIGMVSTRCVKCVLLEKKNHPVTEAVPRLLGKEGSQLSNQAGVVVGVSWRQRHV